MHISWELTCVCVIPIPVYVHASLLICYPCDSWRRCCHCWIVLQLTGAHLQPRQLCLCQQFVSDFNWMLMKGIRLRQHFIRVPCHVRKIMARRSNGGNTSVWEWVMCCRPVVQCKCKCIWMCVFFKYLCVLRRGSWGHGSAASPRRKPPQCHSGLSGRRRTDWRRLEKTDMDKKLHQGKTKMS